MEGIRRWRETGGPEEAARRNSEAWARRQAVERTEDERAGRLTARLREARNGTLTDGELADILAAGASFDPYSSDRKVMEAAARSVWPSVRTA